MIHVTTFHLQGIDMSILRTGLAALAALAFTGIAFTASAAPMRNDGYHGHHARHHHRVVHHRRHHHQVMVRRVAHGH